MPKYELPSGVRWNYAHKAWAVWLVKSRTIKRGVLLKQYSISEEEFQEWERKIKEGGPVALKILQRSKRRKEEIKNA